MLKSVESLTLVHEKTLELARNFSQAHFGVQILKRAGFEAYIVGGAVRDLLLSREPKDFDLSTNANPETVISLFSAVREIRQAKFFAAKQALPIVEVTFNGGFKLEIATFRRDREAKGRHDLKIESGNLADDLLRRDFTINALAFDPDTHKLVDYHGGQEDLKSRLIRFVGDPQSRITEDPLRIIRAIRFKNRLGFGYDPDTEQAIRKAATGGELARIVDTKRIGDELNAMLLAPSRIEALLDLKDLRILEKIFPELVVLTGIEQSPDWHAEGDVWIHSLETLKHLGENPSANLIWATLLHDLGKPQTQTLPQFACDRIRFNGHAEVGAKMVEEILKDRFRFGAKVDGDKIVNRDFVIWMVANHMKIKELPRMKAKTAKELMNHPAFCDLLKLHYADSCGSWRTLPDGTIEAGFAPKSFYEVLARYQNHREQPLEQQKPSLKRDLGIDGRYLMAQFNLSPGPMIGQILTILDEKFIEGEVSTKEEAMELVRQSIAPELD